MSAHVRRIWQSLADRRPGKQRSERARAPRPINIPCPHKDPASTSCREGGKPQVHQRLLIKSAKQRDFGKQRHACAPLSRPPPGQEEGRTVEGRIVWIAILDWSFGGRRGATHATAWDIGGALSEGSLLTGLGWADHVRFGEVGQGNLDYHFGVCRSCSASEARRADATIREEYRVTSILCQALVVGMVVDCRSFVVGCRCRCGWRCRCRRRRRWR